MFTSSFMRVHHRAGAEEQAGLEEAVGEQVHDRERVAGGPEAGGQHHVADLAHRRRGKRLLDVVLGAADDRAEQQRDRADDDHAELCVGRQVEHRAGPHDQVHARGDHGRGVDQRRHRGRALHRVAEPGLQRHLRGLAARGEQQQQPDRGQRALAQLAVRRRRRRRTRWIRCRRTSPSARSARPMSPTRLTTNAFLAAVAADGLCDQNPISR